MKSRLNHLENCKNGSNLIECFYSHKYSDIEQGLS